MGIKVLPAVVLFKHGVSVDRVVGFEQLGGKDDFGTAALEARLRAAEVVSSSRARAAAGGRDDGSDDEDALQRSSIRRGIVHKDAGDESSDFDD